MHQQFFQALIEPSNKPSYYSFKVKVYMYYKAMANHESFADGFSIVRIASLSAL